MKAIVCVLLLAAAAVYGVEEKKNEKRGLLGLGYGLSSGSLLGHGYYSHGLGLYNYGYGLGLGGYSANLGHSVAVAPAPFIGHNVYSSPIYNHGLYGGHIGYGAHLGHGYLH